MSDLKEAIIEAAIGEFSKNGYKNASTNAMAEKGGFSKGLIFHHFTNKKNLYMVCVKHIMDIYLEEFYKRYDRSEPDFLKRYEFAINFKTQYFIDNPEHGRFMVDVNRVYFEKSIPELVDYASELARESWERVCRGADTSKYRKDLPPEKVHGFIKLVMDAYGNSFNYEWMEYEEVMENMKKFWHGITELREMMLYGVYESPGGQE